MNTELYIDLLEKEVTELRLLIKTSELEIQLAEAEHRQASTDRSLVLSHSGKTPSKPSAPAIPKGTV